MAISFRESSPHFGSVLSRIKFAGLSLPKKYTNLNYEYIEDHFQRLVFSFETDNPNRLITYRLIHLIRTKNRFSEAIQNDRQTSSCNRTPEMSTSQYIHQQPRSLFVSYNYLRAFTCQPYQRRAVHIVFEFTLLLWSIILDILEISLWKDHAEL